jgi:hypothetical protein
MEKKVFIVKAEDKNYFIVTESQVDSNPVEHEVWKNGNLLFIINSEINKPVRSGWRLIPEFSDVDIKNELVETIAEEIQKYYL